MPPRFNISSQVLSFDSPSYQLKWYRKRQKGAVKRLLKRVDAFHIYEYGPNGSYEPFRQSPPNTTLLDASDFAKMTKLSSGETETRSDSNIVNMLTNRQKGQFSRKTKCKFYNRCVPNKFDILVGYAAEIYRSNFTKNGEGFITASQDKKLRIYDSGNGFYDIKKSMKIKHVEKIITSLECSPDNEHFVYSTMSPIVNLCKVAEDRKKQYPLVMDDTESRVGILSVSFSADSTELLCGSDDSTVYIYDLKSHRCTLKLQDECPSDSVRFANDSSNVFYTAGCDAIVKLWDRRTMPTRRPKPVGYLKGHRAGIVCMDLHSDDRHLITQSKDSSIKLWDARMQTSDKSFREVLHGDASIMTYRGHSVAYTTTECRFSPVETTGQRYIYTGCDSGRVVVYDALTGEAVQHQVAHVSNVKNVSWHPTRNEILSTGYDGLVGIWKYMDPANIMEPEQIQKDREHFHYYRFHRGLFLDPARRCNKRCKKI